MLDFVVNWNFYKFFLVLSASQEIPCILCNPKVYYRSHKCPPPVLTWKIIKDITGKTQSPVTNMKIKSHAGILTNINDIAKAFNIYFTNIAEDQSNNSSDMDKAWQSLKRSYTESSSEMKLIPVTEIEVIDIIKSLKHKNSLGYDGISNNTLKHCVNEISKPITLIFNYSLMTGIFPNRLKYAIILLIHKKGDKLIMSNYKPISLLLSCSKILETIMFNRLYQYVHTNEILAPEQFGLRKESNIEKTVFSLTDSVLSSLNIWQKTAGIFCDLSKAFDCVNHKILLAKLCHCGIRGVSLNWFKTYITNRKQKVKITTQNLKHISFCRWETIKNGVPQGLILGTLLFVIYVNDLPRSLNKFASPVTYADDTSVLVFANNLKDLQTKIDSTLHYISDWFSFSGLTLNMEKTNMVKFCTNHSLNNQQ